MRAGLLGLGLALAIACSRTEPEQAWPGNVRGTLTPGGGDNGQGGGAAGNSGSLDASTDATSIDGSVDASDGNILFDGPAHDAPSDAPSLDADADAWPDVTVDAPADSPLDALPDTTPVDCVDAGITYIYLIASDATLWSFYPPNGAFSPIGTIACPADPTTNPYSMGVDQHGIAYVVFTDGNLYRVDTGTAGCVATSYVPGQDGFLTFGMGFSRNPSGIGEKLYVAQIDFIPTPPPSKGLATIDTQSFDLSFIGPFHPSPPRMELTGTGTGQLFGYAIQDPGPGGDVYEIDKTNGNILSDIPLPVGSPQSALAFAYWGGRFFIFTTTADQTGTEVSVYDPTVGTATLAFTKPGTIVVGAGVSTCAPD